MSADDLRLDLLAVIMTEAPAAAAGDETALATLVAAADQLSDAEKDLGGEFVWPRDWSPGNVLDPRYAEARAALTPKPEPVMCDCPAAVSGCGGSLMCFRDAKTEVTR